ncbi:MAG: hypothetical protein KF812_11690 [Fimbriimonadaceae bacterium]|nr:hypothetical protein [Fimbriimonadaceae bacterium]
MNSYVIWVNLAPGARDLDFLEAVKAYCGHFIREGQMEKYRIQRRKFGFGPESLGEFMLTLDFRDLTQMDQAFDAAARRSGELERLHHEVYSRVTGFKSGLFRDFPDPVREV